MELETKALGTISLIDTEEVTVYAGHEVLMEVDSYFTDFLLSMGAFRLAAQASPNQLIKFNVILNNYIIVYY
jgi:hypothetical protein